MCEKVGNKVTLSLNDAIVTNDFGGSVVICWKKLYFLQFLNGKIYPCKLEKNIQYNEETEELIVLGLTFKVNPEFVDLGKTRLFKTLPSKEGLFELNIELNEQTPEEKQSNSWSGKLVSLSLT